MSNKLSRLLENLTPEEQAEVETFAIFLLARRSLHTLRVTTDDISTTEQMQLATDSGGFDWLDAPEEDAYSIKDGEAVRWPSSR